MTENDLAMVLEWRNAFRVREFMLTRDEISMEEHVAWFASATRNPARLLLIFEAGGEPRGHMNFKIDVVDQIADWGFYSAPGAPRGTGLAMGRMALEYGFEKLGIHKVCGQVLDFNTTSRKMHDALGFVCEGVLREQKQVSGVWRDLVCYGLLAHEWTACEGKL